MLQKEGNPLTVYVVDKWTKANATYNMFFSRIQQL